MSIPSVSALLPTQAPALSRLVAADNPASASTPSSTTETAKTDTPSTVATEAAKASQVGSEELNKVVEEINDFIKPINNSLQFSIDRDSGTTVVKVIDTDTDEMIKQIPSEEMLALAKAIGQLKGLLVKQQA